MEQNDGHEENINYLSPYTPWKAVIMTMMFFKGQDYIFDVEDLYEVYKTIEQNGNYMFLPLDGVDYENDIIVIGGVAIHIRGRGLLEIVENYKLPRGSALKDVDLVLTRKKGKVCLTEFRTNKDIVVDGEIAPFYYELERRQR